MGPTALRCATGPTQAPPRRCTQPLLPACTRMPTRRMRPLHRKRTPLPTHSTQGLKTHARACLRQGLSVEESCRQPRLLSCKSCAAPQPAAHESEFGELADWLPRCRLCEQEGK